MVLIWATAIVLAYAYAGYPLLLLLIVRVRGRRPVRFDDDHCPPVTMVISAYNEAAVIREKLENVLALDYPRDRFDVVVISDASSDGTDDIVREYAAAGISLARQPVRRGKTAGLNHAVPGLAGEIVVFSDANAMYEPSAIRRLVRNFADPRVGCVTGEARYRGGGRSAADDGERAYWNYEIQIKRLETAVGSMVGGDGAIYAIRKQLWKALPDNAINDFLNPLQIVEAGWRAVYEPEAVCFEETAGGVGTEYRRRVRIVSRSWRAVFQARGVLNPFRVGFFTLALLSHKILRWVSGVFLALLLLSLSVVMLQAARTWSGRTLLGVAITGLALALVPGMRRLAQYSVYFAVITYASVIGVVKGSLGRVSGTWSTPREATGADPGMRLFAPGRAILALLGCGLALVAAVTIGAGAVQGLRLVFWLSIGMLLYVYVVYPIVLALVSTAVHRPVRRGSIEPTVCLFITANDEETVIRRKLQNALALDYPREKLTIVVASDGSVDGTNTIVRSFEAQGIRLLAFPERRGKVAALNDGMATVTSDVVIFSDANTFLDARSIRMIVRNFDDVHVGAVSGDVVLEGERAQLGMSEDLYYRYERWLQQCESRIGTMVGVDGALYGIRRELFRPPASDTILDDMAIPMAVARAGRRVIFEPAAQARERGSETATEEFVRKARVVAGAVQFLQRGDSAVPIGNRQLIVTLLSHKALRWMSPAFALLAFAAALALSATSGWFMIVAAGQVLFLSAGIAGCSPALRRLTIVSLAHYFWLVQAAAALGFLRGLVGRQPVAWRRFGRPPAESVS